ncbi:electron transport complex subunit RsxD [Halioglobus japonicus]|uniref:Ion-translocating oxidoreductase complex subunit D n=1 Tax=Halioglobus japonicus TaxID=930805 RepID=A0AAP8MGG8_9GAMM|nr:electron transport complex subunit RsxD [Halioglobus japonicus]AQA19887.1 electron transport complex subunit RsxD [Halioglobus japonicus]PLW87037.1 electron transport complex subunit RsxD [Halioglobus japonicus]GHD10543.1 electron transport complex subunit D [Halioglobus japonicus]
MALMRITSPHAHTARSTSDLMQNVLLATVPGVLVLTYFFGFGTLLNIAWACVLAIAFESLALKLRGRPLAFYLKDCSALVTAVLLGIALPPYSPWWLIAVGMGSAILLAKHLYGGMGYNPFNPAMVGYVVLLISFPVQMTSWAAPRGAGELPDLMASFQALFTPAAFDAVTMATPLDVLKQNNSLLMEDLWQANPQFGRWGGLGWEWVNIAFLAGGLWLIYQRVFTWHAPVAMLVVLALMSALFYDGGSSASGGSPLFHLLSGATMFGAFFIVTDPVSSAVSNRGRLIYGGMIGLLVYLIRVWGNYPDAVAFAVLIMNLAAPFIDQYTQPRTYGHNARGTK